MLMEKISLPSPLTMLFHSLGRTTMSSLLYITLQRNLMDVHAHLFVKHKLFLFIYRFMIHSYFVCILEIKN